MKKGAIAVCLSIALCIPNIKGNAQEFTKEEIRVPISSKEAAESYILKQLLNRERNIQFESSSLFLTTEELEALTYKAARRQVVGIDYSGDYLRQTISTGFFSAYDREDGKRRYTMQILYNETWKETKAVGEKMKSPVKKAKKKKLTYNKLKYLSNWIVRQVRYDYFGSYNTAYEAVLYKRSKCMGYCMLAQRMFTAAGIPSKIVLGTVKGRGNHAWNAVKFGSKWYYVDVCWMDSLDGKKSNMKYFLFGQKTCKKERTILSGYSVKGISKKDYGEKKYKNTPSRIYLQ